MTLKSYYSYWYIIDFTKNNFLRRTKRGLFRKKTNLLIFLSLQSSGLILGQKKNLYSSDFQSFLSCCKNIPGSKVTCYLHVQHDVIHKVRKSSLDGPAELAALHQGVHKLKDGEHQVLKAQHL